MPEESNPKWIKASPTKAFFIHMLTRDVPLTRAILDLIDNCIDGAIRERDGGKYDGLWVRVELSRDEFRIADNCGGIPVKIAREYAFRFGRPEDAQETSGSIGQFGVGMKRSFFKLGRYFSVESKASDSSFTLNVDVDKWMQHSDDERTSDWHFEFDSVAENLTDVPSDAKGTIIEIKRLRDGVGDNFEVEQFCTRLADEISAAHSLSMDRGLAISVNGIPIRHTPHNLLISTNLKPAFVQKEYARTLIDGEATPPVKVKLYAGVSERSLHDGGWYIFCNGRLVLRADQTSTTVWGPAHNLRQYHPDYAYFRGFAYFDSDHAALLPWTTTKTGVDVDSKIYRMVQQEMIEITRPVLDFLNRLERERRDRENGDSVDEPLQVEVKNAVETRAEGITIAQGFVAPASFPRPTGPRYQKIQYTKRAELVEKVKKLLGVTTFTAVGEKTFDYYLENKGED
ncbi:MAG: ATP-binding protein [Verrucomicrobiaceae bacterium]|nr:ATP-binding protein [Verrucomicrobiaceae bacterium]